MSLDKIVVVGAREHNLKNINVEIPRDKFVVITGLSGSGKSSLAFDTIFAEGQRRYVESLSAYARQFLGQLEKPDVDQIEGLSPAISIDQKGVRHNPRSTVGTVTEVYDYLRLLYARVGIPHCPNCGREVQQQSAQQIVEAVGGLPGGSRIQVLSPVVRHRKGHHKPLFDDIRKQGFVRVRVDGDVLDLEEVVELDRYKNHSIEIVVDRLVIPEENGDESEADLNALYSRLTDSIETALQLGDGNVVINNMGHSRNGTSAEDLLYSEHLACAHCQISLPEIEPRSFSFNTPHGACPTCQGLGTQLELDPERVVINPNLSVFDGALHPWNVKDHQGYYWQLLESVCAEYDIPLDKPFGKLKKKEQQLLLYGSGGEKMVVNYENRDGRKATFETKFEGVIPNLERRYYETTSDYIRGWIEEYMTESLCPDCDGRRLRPESLAVTVGGAAIDAVTSMPVKDALDWVAALRGESDGEVLLAERDLEIGRQVFKELVARLGFMVNVGLDYLTLNRAAGTLSGGEAQRIRLATQIGSQLTGVLYVLDEPSIGLHQRDNQRLIQTLEGMRDLGNTLLVVEHDEETMRHADWIVDLGPGAGEYGGEVVAEGTVAQIEKHKTSITGAFLSGRRRIALPETRREGNGLDLVLQGAAENNLKTIDVSFPLGKLICVTGVSGSGKSTLVVDVLYKRLAQLLHGARDKAGAHKKLLGLEAVDKVINIDQSPIGRTPRSNPGTYTKLFDDIRSLFAELPESKVRGYAPGRFSFNVKGGRCEACAGQGQLEIEMQFLPDIYIACEVCGGKRYNRETLQVRFNGKSVADVLDMSISEGLAFFEAFPSIVRKLETLDAVGLGYIRIGQPAPTLSGGEAQRVKLSRELSKRATGQTFYVLDEPSVGLHAADVEKLIYVLQALVDQGNTAVIIEHNPDIIKVADHLIDLGPEGGNLGGYVIAQGTPEEVAQVEDSYTGQFLAHYLATH